MEFKFSKFNTAKSAIAFIGLTTLLLTGCGGGGGGGGGGGPNYVTWTDNANGTVIKDGANNNFSVNASTRAVVSLASHATLGGLTVDNNGNVIDNGTTVAAVVLNYSSSGSKISEFACSGPAPQFGAMTISETSAGWSYTCASNSGSSNSSGSSSGSTSYTSWTGSANGTTIMDAASHQFGVNSSTSAVVALASNTILTGLTVNSSAQVLYNGSLIGSVSLASSMSGSQIAEFFCSDGNPMTITVSSSWSTSCGGSGTTSGSSSGSSGSSTTPTIAPVNNCIYLYPSYGTSYLANQCNIKVEVTWKDQGTSCNNGGGCEWSIGPNTYTSAGGGIVGHVDFVACPYPAIPNLASGTCQ